MGLSLPRHKLTNSVLRVLSYFSRFDYPLTAEEIYLWQEETPFSYPTIRRFLQQEKVFPSQAKLYFLPGHEENVTHRQQRSDISLRKLHIARSIGDQLQRLPFIQAVFITGALAMKNSPEYDDIDLMIITSPHTLWITRFIVISYLRFHGLRRPPNLPEHQSRRVSNTICDNLWLDTHHLKTLRQDLYTAHELLQSKCLWDHNGVHHQLLSQNSWVKKYLPIAYPESIKRLKLNQFIKNSKLKIGNYYLLLAPLNLLFFLAQYLYMLPRKTSEKVHPGYAYFHPRDQN